MMDQGEIEFDPEAADPLTWEGSYAIARALMRSHPQVKLDEVSLRTIYQWIIELPDFDDDPVLANEEILNSIYNEWFEEVNTL
jgi:FeS assembly protein IscX